MFHKCTIICTSQNKICLGAQLKFSAAIIISVYFIFYFRKSLWCMLRVHIWVLQMWSKLLRCRKPFIWLLLGQLPDIEKNRVTWVFKEFETELSLQSSFAFEDTMYAVKLYSKRKENVSTTSYSCVLPKKINSKNALTNIRLN